MEIGSGENVTGTRTGTGVTHSETTKTRGRLPHIDRAIPDQWRREAGDFALLLAFANVGRPVVDWSAFPLFRRVIRSKDDGGPPTDRAMTPSELAKGYRLFGEPFTLVALDEMHGQLQRDLQAICEKRFSTAIGGGREVSFTWWFTAPAALSSQDSMAHLGRHFDRMLLSSQGNTVDLDQYFDWLLFELLRQRLYLRLFRCAWCGRFGIGSRADRVYCEDRPCKVTARQKRERGRQKSERQATARFVERFERAQLQKAKEADESQSIASQVAAEFHRHATTRHAQSRRGDSTDSAAQADEQAAFQDGLRIESKSHVDRLKKPRRAKLRDLFVSEEAKKRAALIEDLRTKAGRSKADKLRRRQRREKRSNS